MSLCCMVTGIGCAGWWDWFYSCEGLKILLTYVVIGYSIWIIYYFLGLTKIKSDMEKQSGGKL